MHLACQTAGLPKRWPDSSLAFLPDFLLDRGPNNPLVYQPAGLPRSWVAKPLNCQPAELTGRCPATKLVCSLASKSAGLRAHWTDSPLA
jgi:hypothetical protein